MDVAESVDFPNGDSKKFFRTAEPSVVEMMPQNCEGMCTKRDMRDLDENDT